MKKPVKYDSLGNPIIFISDKPEDIQKALLEGYSMEECEIGYNGAFYLQGKAPELDIDTARAIALCKINTVYEEKALSVKADTPDSEVATWNIQKDEAEKWQNNNKVSTPFVDALAFGRKMDREVLLGKILEKSNAFNLFMAQLTGTRQYYEDLIKDAKTVDEVGEISWED